MRKKNTAQDIEDMKQIIREFPGTIARKVSAKGKLYGYDFTDEQLDWLEANCTERDDNLYIHYVFPDFQLTLGYASFDI